MYHLDEFFDDKVWVREVNGSRDDSELAKLLQHVVNDLIVQAISEGIKVGEVGM